MNRFMNLSFIIVRLRVKYFMASLFSTDEEKIRVYAFIGFAWGKNNIWLKKIVD